MAVEVAEAAAQEEEAAAGEQVGVDDPDQRRLAEAEVGADRRQRDVDDRHVEHDHEDAEADDAEGEPAARGRDRVGHQSPGAGMAKVPILVVRRRDESTGNPDLLRAVGVRGLRAVNRSHAHASGDPSGRRWNRRPQAWAMFWALNGMRRTRLPVAANTALATAGPINAVAGSPMPPGFSVLCTSVISIAGDSFMRTIR